MSSNRITFNILPADNTDMQTDMEMDTSRTQTTTTQLGEVVKESPVTQEVVHDKECAMEIQTQDAFDQRDAGRVIETQTVSSGPNAVIPNVVAQGMVNPNAGVPGDIGQNSASILEVHNCGTNMSTMTQAVNQGINQAVNQDANQNANQDINQDVNQDVTQDINQDATQDTTQDAAQQFSTQFFTQQQFQSGNQTINGYDNQNFVYMNDGINIIDPTAYSPMVYVVEGNKMIYSNSYPFVYDSGNKIHKNSSLPYAYISRNSYVKPDFNIVQNKLKLYNYWIETTDPKRTEAQIVEMFGSENIYVTKSLFFRKKSSYMGEKVILISKLPQKPFKFINRINRTFTKDRRSIKSVLGDYIISPDCLFIVLAERSIDYICNNYYRYHKNERTKIETLIKSFKQKFTCIDETDII